VGSALSILGALFAIAKIVAEWFQRRNIGSEAQWVLIGKSLEVAMKGIEDARAIETRIRTDLELHPDRVRDDDGFRRPED
jgi:hypothetical protein